MSEDEFQIKVHVGDDASARLEWGAVTNLEVLSRAVSLAADDAIVGHGVRRIEAEVPAEDRLGRRALQSAGFRLEGLRRQAHQVAEDQYVDVRLYARLASDIAYGPHAFSSVSNSVLPRTRCMAHVLFHRADGRLLFCTVDYKDDLELPGGIVEMHEPPRQAAAREVAEEIGLRVENLVLRSVDWMPPHLGWDDALEFTFDGGLLDADRIAGLECREEIVSLHWLTWAEARERVIPTVARRLATLEHTEGPAYLERGQAPGDGTAAE